MDALHENGSRMKPIICACLAQKPTITLIVGVCSKPRVGAIKGNSFGYVFRAAAEERGIECCHELFESSWIELDTAAINSFMVRINLKIKRHSR